MSTTTTPEPPHAALRRILHERVPDQADAIYAEFAEARRAYERHRRRQRDVDLIRAWDALTDEQRAARRWRERQVVNARRRLAE